MNFDKVENLARAVRYEGYLLYPYRPSSVKNQQRFNFGVVYPRDYSEAQGASEPWSMQTECLVHGGMAALDARIRFLHLVQRDIGKFSAPLTEWMTDSVPEFQQVETLELDGEVFQTWQESAEQTGTICHLDAEMVRRSLAEWKLDDLDILFIENVGNMVCPSSYDLGEDLRLVLMSVTEGEDKPLKYPTIFNTADVAVITKMDLAAATEFDLAETENNIQSVRPGMEVIRVSARTGEGMEDLLLRLSLPFARREPFAVGAQVTAVGS